MLLSKGCSKQQNVLRSCELEVEVCGADVTPNSKCQARRKLSTEISAKIGQKSKSEEAWPNSKDPKGNS